MGLSAKRCFMKNKNHVRLDGLKRARKIDITGTPLPYDLPIIPSDFGIAPPENKPHQINPFKQDIFALGLILHLLMTKRYPDEYELKHLAFELDDYFPYELRSLLKTMLDKKPENRPTIDDIIRNS